MKRSAATFKDDDQCPWCSKDYDSAHRRDRALIKPCKHSGCVLCLLRVLRSGQGPHPCKTCGVAIKTFSAVEADSQDQEKKQKVEDKGKEEEPEEEEGGGGADEEGGDEEEEPNEEQEIAWLSKQCSNYEPPEDWTCQICSFAYDHLQRQPVKVVKCYAIKKVKALFFYGARIWRGGFRKQLLYLLKKRTRTTTPLSIEGNSLDADTPCATSACNSC